VKIEAKETKLCQSKSSKKKLKLSWIKEGVKNPGSPKGRVPRKKLSDD
jgi:hypothetical protein